MAFIGEPCPKNSTGIGTVCGSVAFQFLRRDKSPVCMCMIFTYVMDIFIMQS
jgi:hypothetical protein